MAKRLGALLLALGSFAPSSAFSYAQRDYGDPGRSVLSADGRDIRLVSFKVVDQDSSVSPSEGCSVPPSDFQLAIVEIQVTFWERPLAAPKRVSVIDVLDRVFVDECATRKAGVTIKGSGKRDLPPEPALPVKVTYSYVIPIRPGTPISKLKVDDVVFKEPLRPSAPN